MWNIVGFLLVFIHLVCHDNGYKPKHGIRKPPIHLGLQFLNGSKLRYVCDVNYKLVPAITTQVCINGNWVPSAPPTCIAGMLLFSVFIVQLKLINHDNIFSG